ncbi:hypothetical protein [Kineococcus sp. SYSU DK018]|uniref:hypothetical protein n=1 Tax=Kineococcus sp. SYSU DK018 TaxID=3383139 RepID=UPI003D7C8A6C
MPTSIVAPRAAHVTVDVAAVLARLGDQLVPAVLPTVDDLAAVRSSFAAARTVGQLEGWDSAGIGHDVREGRTFRLELGLGVAACRSFDAARSERAAQRLADQHRRDADLRAAAVLAGRDGDEAPVSGRAITEWSRKSRARMVRTLASVDYGPLFAEDGDLALVTLSYWGNAAVGVEDDSWTCSAPRGSVAAEHLRVYRSRLERVFGPRHAVWKEEFQDRGAPHWHLLQSCPALAPLDEHDDAADVAPHVHEGPLPKGVRRASLCQCSPFPRNVHEGPLLPGRSRASLCRCGTFRRWLALTWSDIVRKDADRRVCLHRHDHDQLAARHLAVHLREKTISFSDTAHMSDHKRIAVYFLKHSTKSSGAKEYQHVVPRAWQGAGNGPGRFWGLWNLQRPTVLVDVDLDDFVDARRAMRRAARARAGRIAYERVRGMAGEAGLSPAAATALAMAGQHVHGAAVAAGLSGKRLDELTAASRVRRLRSFGHRGSLSGGWMIVNDGVSFAHTLGRWLATRPARDRSARRTRTVPTDSGLLLPPRHGPWPAGPLPGDELPQLLGPTRPRHVVGCGSGGCGCRSTGAGVPLPHARGADADLRADLLPSEPVAAGGLDALF